MLVDKVNEMIVQNALRSQIKGFLSIISAVNIQEDPGNILHILLSITFYTDLSHI